MVDDYWICAQICYVIANLTGFSSKSYSFEKFLPRQPGRRSQKQTVEESLESVRAVMGE